MQITKRKLISTLLVGAFVLSLSGLTTAFANNHADTPYKFSIAYNGSANTESRAKYDASSTYINCTSNTGTAIVQSNGKQKGVTYSWGPKYPVGKGAQFIYNYVWENRPDKSVAAYCYLRFQNPNVKKTITTQGYWSPDSVPE